MSKGSKIYEYFTEIADEEKIVCNQCHDWFDIQEYETTHGPIGSTPPSPAPTAGSRA
jgi:hypothetical protein